MSQPRILIIGASRGLGHAMAAQFLHKGWHVTGTVRADAGTPLHALAAQHTDALDIEQLDIRDAAQLQALKQRLDHRHFDILFVNAGITNRDPNQTIGEVSTEEFIEVMLTNALSPLRVIEQLQDKVTSDGMIGIMSSGQGSITDNTRGQRELYRGSKAALNMFMRSYAARHASGQRAMVLMAPGWVRTELGGADAPYSMDENVPKLVNVLLEKMGRPGLEYLDFRGDTVPW
ncbi:SDR family NAD(P)-dependent oxidoreductase [Oleiagrimonas sp. C23AA]|uniref:SDR family NAD(P)-dependent oxidoreductase n=1 Tax=Oleiagrimonas sp. C23AA TaxID=2719047 RepID=UPI00141F5341|nr:SDR family NAD(P)-dependent oxidoreductase [Oleiagrimonas sp. C23AA]NII09512.1 SDR family NAD(P)-dependent oxidoreductase [Oleiagrimonas sp. C23AA]